MSPSRGGSDIDDGPASTGISGLDEVLHGGLPRDEMHLVQGAAGTGKTTLALQFLLAGVKNGESCLYITLSQTQRGLLWIARSHGWSLSGVTVHELETGGVLDQVLEQQTVLHTAEVELSELTLELRRLVARVKPRRVVLDSIDVIGLLAGGSQRYRREIVALRRFLAGQGCTALFLGDWPADVGLEAPGSAEFQNLATSVIHLEQRAPEYGNVRRRVQVIKVRGVRFHGGYHNFRIRKGGLEVYPRLGLYSAPEYTEFRRVESGIATFDALLGGGLEQGTAVLFVGPSGTGKSTLAAAYARAAARSGRIASIFLFDERPETVKARSKGVGLDLEPHLASGHIVMQQLQAAEVTPGEFAQQVRSSVENDGAEVVVIDSLTGYFNALENAPMLAVQMHELLNFLSRRGVLTILIVVQAGFMTVGPTSSIDVSYLSDSIVLFRMFEAEGRVRRCISAIKKRQGEHETTIRELHIRPGGVDIGEEPMRQYRFLFTGHPEPVDDPEAGAGRGRGPGGRSERG